VFLSILLSVQTSELLSTQCIQMYFPYDYYNKHPSLPRTATTNWPLKHTVMQIHLSIPHFGVLPPVLFH